MLATVDIGRDPAYLNPTRIGECLSFFFFFLRMKNGECVIIGNYWIDWNKIFMNQNICEN